MTYRVLAAVVVAVLCGGSPRPAAAAELVYLLEVSGFPASNQMPSNRQQALTFTVKIHPNAPSSRTETNANGQVCLRSTADWEWAGSVPSLPTLPSRTATRSATGTIKAKGAWTNPHNALFTAALGVCPDNQQSLVSNEVSRSLSVAAGGGGGPTITGPVASVCCALMVGGLVGYSWSEKVTTMNGGMGVDQRLGTAEDTIAGNSLRDIVTTSGVKVRADNKACVECHGWASTSTRQDFCGRVASFNARGEKPPVLKRLFNEWKRVNCPE